VVNPPQSGWFANYAADSDSDVVSLQNQTMYTEDWIGLQQLDTSNRLAFFTTDCPHTDYPKDVCKKWFVHSPLCRFIRLLTRVLIRYDLYTAPLLNNTFISTEPTSSPL